MIMCTELKNPGKGVFVVLTSQLLYGKVSNELNQMNSLNGSRLFGSSALPILHRLDVASATFKNIGSSQLVCESTDTHMQSYQVHPLPLLLPFKLYFLSVFGHKL